MPFSSTEITEIYSKTVIQAVKKGATSLAALHKMAKVKKLWNPGGGMPRNGCDGQSMAKNLIATIQVNFVLIP